MYILTPPQLRDNPPPEYCVEQWGLTDKIVNELHDWVRTTNPVQNAGYVKEGEAEHDYELRSTDISWIDTNTNPELYNLLGGVIHHANDHHFNIVFTMQTRKVITPCTLMQGSKVSTTTAERFHLVVC